MNNVYFVHQISHNKTTDTWSKGIVIKNDPDKDNEAAALQAYHAFWALMDMEIMLILIMFIAN